MAKLLIVACLMLLCMQAPIHVYCTHQLSSRMSLYNDCQQDVTNYFEYVSFSVVDAIDYVSNDASYLEQWSTALTCTGSPGTTFRYSYQNKVCIKYPAVTTPINVTNSAACYGDQTYYYTYGDRNCSTTPNVTVQTIWPCITSSGGPYIQTYSCFPGLLTPTATPAPPTQAPTPAPTTAPTVAPTTAPTNAPPTGAPTTAPTNPATAAPSTAPTATPNPSSTPTPSPVPTSSSTPSPSSTPTPTSTPTPSTAPTSSSTTTPTSKPTSPTSSSSASSSSTASSSVPSTLSPSTTGSTETGTATAISFSLLVSLVVAFTVL